MHTPTQGSTLAIRCREGDAKRFFGVEDHYDERGGRYLEQAAIFDSRHAAGLERPGSTLSTSWRGVQACTLQPWVAYWPAGIARVTQDDSWGWKATILLQFAAYTLIRV